MSDSNGDQPAAAGETLELVGRFADQESFRAAVEGLRAAGFERSDLSVLDTHESLSASKSPREAWQETLAGLVGEVKYVGPITTAGLIAIATGPVGMAIAAAVAAGLTGVALRELLAEIRATPHTDDFARALEGGALLLWVAVATPEHEAEARQIMARHNAADLHTHRRAPGG
ncbi:MAG: hypothetical protein QNJ67_01335 [Kiloniellales bacterium]|nr:hypothetical protein [Kiloniellales bacterium]